MLDGVPESSYTARATQFAASGQFVGTPGSGTLIAPNWVLTVGHLGNPTGFQFGGTGTVHAVTQFIRHPTFIANGSNLIFGFDIALAQLATPVTNVTPATIYRGSSELGQTATITGFGVGGFGSTGVTLPSAHRAGTNVLDGVFNFNDGPGGQIGISNAAFVTDFDSGAAAANTSGSSSTTELEYQLATGDSGGGVYIVEDGQTFLVALNSAIASQRDVTGSGSTDIHGYGAISVYTRVSSYQLFIDNLVAVPEPGSLCLAALVVPGFWFLRRSRVGTK